MSFYELLNDSEINKSIVTMIVTKQINDLYDVVSEAIITPILSIDLNNDGKSDVKSITDKTIVFCGAEFKLGKLLFEIIKFSIIFFVIYMLMHKKN